MTANVAGGRPGSSITWESATFKFYAGVNRSVAVDSFRLAGAVLDTVWNGAIPSPGQRSSRWWVQATYPFSVRIEFSYYYETGPRPAVKQAGVQFNCGRAASAGPAPEINDVVFTPGTAAYLNDSVVVGFSVASSLGVWATRLQVTGACKFDKFFFERYEPNVQHAVRFPLPNSCEENARLHASVSAVDYLMQVSPTLDVAGPILHPPPDSSPPQLHMGLLRPGQDHPTSRFFLVGDPFRVEVQAFERGYRPPWLGYRLSSGVQDSMISELIETYPRSTTTEDSLYGRVLERVVPQEWVGTQGVRVFARDRAGQLTDSSLGNIRFISAVTHPSASASVPGTLDEWMYDAKRDRLLLASADEAWVAVLPVPTMVFAPRIELPARIRSMDLSEGGDSLVYTLFGDRGRVYFRNLVTGTTTSVDLGITAGSLDRGVDRVRLMAGRKLLVSVTSYSLTGFVGALLEYNLTTGGQREIARDITEYVVLVRSPDRQRAFVGHGHGATLYNAASGAINSPWIEFSGYSQDLASFDATGSRIAIGRRVLDESLRELYRMAPTRYSGPGSGLSPDATYLYGAFANGFLKARVSDGELLEIARTTFEEARIKISPNGNTMFAIDGLRVHAIDLTR